jgi:putative addiction module CopG family antidote
MNEPLTEQEREELITRKIESGLYRSRDDVIDTALRLLDERDKYIAELRDKVQLVLSQQSYEG